jgi:D-xylose transport system permease protein
MGNPQNSKSEGKYVSMKKIDIRTFTMVAVLILLWIIFTTLTSKGFTALDRSFISFRNISNLLRQMSIVGIIGSSMVLLIVTGGIDLSAGVVAGFVGCVAAYLQVFHNMGTALTIIICLIVGVVPYLVQGSLIAHTLVPPFIVTLGGQLVFKGLILALTKGMTIAPLKDSLLYFGQSYFSRFIGILIGALLSAVVLANEISRRKQKIKHGTLTEKQWAMIARWLVITAGIAIMIFVMDRYRGMPVPVLIMFVVALTLNTVAARTTFGRSIYAIGGNLDAAKYAGIKVKKNLVIVYATHGLMVAIAGLILAARLNSGPVTAANMNLELDAIAAAVIGGTSMTGGVGKVVGALLGALIMESINNGMSMMNIDAFWQYILKGIILVAAVWFDSYTRSRKK